MRQFCAHFPLVCQKNLIIPTYWSELMDIVKIICAILLPPLGVFLQVGIGKDFWINLLLTIFGLYILGLVHAIWVIARER
ncbi:salt-stress induced hydrophobic peptide [Synechocystis sp. PCC 6803]|nr:salt-stress induced hydrophobic peptide [Synechocystis sp. PCC 6803]BAA10728.1 salt-stress induced hydrophobic peptide [Synechocystis sp. PCC 6803]